jgi:hypothetical protein
VKENFFNDNILCANHIKKIWGNRKMANMRAKVTVAVLALAPWAGQQLITAGVLYKESDQNILS